MPRQHRTDDAYEIEALSKGLKVLEALKGTRWEPVGVTVIMERTGMSRDAVDRNLKTLRMHGYATCEKGKWTAGRRVILIAETLVRFKNVDYLADLNSRAREFKDGRSQ